MSVSSMREYPEPLAAVSCQLSEVVRVCVEMWVNGEKMSQDPLTHLSHLNPSAFIVIFFFFNVLSAFISLFHSAKELLT